MAVGGPAWQAGIRPGDTILEINGEKQSEFTEMLMIIALADQDTKLNMKIQRGGEVFETQVTPLVDPRGRGMTIGIMTNAEPVIQYVQPDSPAFEAGLKSGDRITHVEYTDPETQQTVRTAVNSYRDVTTIVQNPKLIGKQVTLEVLRGDPEQPEKLRLTVVPEIPETAPKLIGIAALSTRIDAIRNGSKAAGKFQVNDIILTTDGAEVYSLAELRKTAFEKDKLPLTLRVEREGATREVSVSGIDLANWIDDEISFNAVSMEKIPPVAGDIQAGMPATLAGMRPGDLITHMDGRQVAVFEEIRAAIRAKRGEPVEVTWSRKKPDGTMETQTAALTPAPQRIGYIGVMYRQDRFILRKGFFGAIATGFRRTILWGERVFLIIKGLFTRDISPKNLAGPVGIFTISYAVTQFGIGTLLYFLAMISINLAIINVFPVPVLDGGHLLFLGIEKVKGSPVALKTQVAAQTVGLVLLLSMAIFVTYNDIARLIWGM